jgi:hypothetical protein
MVIYLTGGVAALSGHCYATGSSGTSAACLMTPFQSLSSSEGGDISIQGQAPYLHCTPVGR